MKKKFIVLLVMLLTLSVVFVSACSKKAEAPAPAESEKDADTEDTDTEEDSDAADDPSETETSDDEKDAEADAEEDTAVDTDAEADTETAVAEDVLGESTDTVYTNNFFGIKFEVPNDNWYILQKDELGQLMGLAAASIDDDAISEMLQSSGYVIDFYTMDTSQTFSDAASYNNINIAIEDIGTLYGIMYDEKQLAENSKDLVVQTLQAQGATDVTAEVGETEFAGKTRTCMLVTGTTNGLTMYEKQVYIKNESYIASITAAAFTEDKTDELLSYFTASE